MTVLLVAVLGGCSWLSDSRKFSVYFEPYSAALNQQGNATIAAAADFARTHPLQPVAIDGFSAPPDPKQDVDGLSAQRAEAVKQGLVGDGVAPARITTAANGIIEPKTLPSVAVRRVDIAIGE
ncbi:MAG TPA: OmpA family protein [Rhodopila sp.]|nr:OmpA family protein [Rhodopila sp.]